MTLRSRNQRLIRDGAEALAAYDHSAPHTAEGIQRPNGGQAMTDRHTLGDAPTVDAIAQTIARYQPVADPATDYTTWRCQDVATGALLPEPFADEHAAKIGARTAAARAIIELFKRSR